jgi:biopolymer transport protein ExbB
MPALFLALALLLVPSISHAWWKSDWKQREKVQLDTSAQGVETKQALTGVAVAVRLHAGNFSFGDAKPDGSDLRFVAADDKTLLKHYVERFDATNELAVVWVQLPALAPGNAAQTIWLYHGNPNAPDASDPKGVFDGGSAVFNFSEPNGEVRDAMGSVIVLPKSKPGIEQAGLLGASARFGGEAMELPEAPALVRAAGANLSVSLWMKPTTVAKMTLYRQGSLELGVDAGGLVLRSGASVLAKGGAVKADAWQHVALVADGTRAALYLNGAEVGSANAPLPALSGQVSIGEGFLGLMDALQIAPTARTPDWIKVAVRSQGADNDFPQVVSESEGGDEGGSHSYFGILIKNLTPDAWVVIGILGVMFVIAAAVMVGKARFISRTDSANRRFLARFRDAEADFIAIGADRRFANSSLFRLYEAGVRELKKRVVGASAGAAAAGLSGASVNAIKAAIDADLVRESHRLNGQMVLLTIAISGGPFLGLLGTVVGVMITFAAIAAAGDVNVNAIAPGIAAALLATVAGLGVAIPSLFGYNYLASRIKNISADMQIFVDEFVTRVAEQYGAGA